MNHAFFTIFSDFVTLRYLSDKSSGLKKLNQKFWPWIQAQLEFEWLDGSITKDIM